MMSADDQHQAHEILDSVISNDEIQEFMCFMLVIC